MNKDNEQYFYSSNKKDTIYNEHLKPLKAKISRILLYDTEIAATFLQEYNEIIIKEEMSTILEDIVELELKIGEYEKNRGKEKVFEERSMTIIKQLEDLLEKAEQLDINDFESKFSDIKEMYNQNLENYNYQDRDAIEQNISSIQAKLIMRKVRDSIIDLHSEIAEEDVANLTMVINNAIYTLTQSKNSNIQDIVNEIKYKMMNRTDVVYDVEIWRLLDSAQINGERINQHENQPQRRIEQNSSSTLLPAIPKQSKGFSFPSLGQIFQRKTLRIGNQKMLLADTVKIGDMTVKVKDLAKINMDWLVEKVPEEMLNNAEDINLRKESRFNIRERYMPDKKTPIYDLVENNTREVNKIKEQESKFDFYDDERNENHCKIVMFSSGTKIRLNNIDNAIVDKVAKSFFQIESYVTFIDTILQSDLLQQFHNETSDRGGE